MMKTDSHKSKKSLMSLNHLKRRERVNKKEREEQESPSSSKERAWNKKQKHKRQIVQYEGEWSQEMN